jgi:hypothetical protein
MTPDEGRLGPWRRNPISGDPTDPPHVMPYGIGVGPRKVDLFPIYADDAGTDLIALRDWDGCEADVLVIRMHPSYVE